ncbi:hypothetical protein [Winogradskyella sp.]|uniref:hypothetical protein n=1 Tax=Winogradskyella sp. TaxID=1883156 RepID=UPI003BABA4A2
MKKNFVLLLMLLGGFLNVVSQSKTAPYKYVVVPLQYDFLDAKDKFRLNTLTRVLLKGEGFNVFFSEGEQLPEDLSTNRCLAMYADVHKVKGGFLKTKLKMSFKDCFGNVLLESEEGASREKDFAVAYKDALNKAYVTLDFSKIQNKAVSEQLALVKEPPPSPEIDDVEEEVLDEEIEIVEQIDQSIQRETKKEEQVLYAQPITNGFQLVDTTPKKVMVLLKTAKPNVFIVKGKNAIVYKEKDQWLYSETTENRYDVVPLNIKF